MALNRVWMPSPCYHGRSTSGVRLIVLHTAEGARTIESLGNFFANYNNQVSSHVGADDQRGKIGEYVKPGNAAWTQANYNNAAVSLELCGFASWSTSEWKNNHANMLQNCADWIAEEAKRFGIPITKLSNSQAQGSGRGVCQHVNLGAGGGGHVDCGSGFPMDYVLDLARGKAPSQPQGSDQGEDEEMQLMLDANKRACLVFTNDQANGKYRLRLGCRTTAAVRVEFKGFGTSDLTLGYDQGAQGLAIPKDCKFAVIRVDSGGDSPIAYCFSV